MAGGGCESGTGDMADLLRGPMGPVVPSRVGAAEIIDVWLLPLADVDDSYHNHNEQKTP